MAAGRRGDECARWVLRRGDGRWMAWEEVGGASRSEPSDAGLDCATMPLSPAVAGNPASPSPGLEPSVTSLNAAACL